SYFLKPGASTARVKAPGNNSVNRNRPSLSVLAKRVCPVWLLEIWTLAFGTAAPLGSVMVPESCPVRPCPRSVPDENTTHRTHSAPKARNRARAVDLLFAI